MVNIDYTLLVSLKNKLESVFNTSSYVIAPKPLLNINNKSKKYIWVSPSAQDKDYMKRDFGVYYITIHAVAIDKVSLKTIKNTLYNELDKTSIDNYNYMLTMLDYGSRVYDESYNGVIYKHGEYDIVVSGSIVEYMRYLELTSNYRIVD